MGPSALSCRAADTALHPSRAFSLQPPAGQGHTTIYKMTKAPPLSSGGQGGTNGHRNQRKLFKNPTCPFVGLPTLGNLRIIITGSFAVSMALVCQDVIKFNPLKINVKPIQAFAFLSNLLHPAFGGAEMQGPLEVAPFPSLLPLPSGLETKCSRSNFYTAIDLGNPSLRAGPPTLEHT